MSTKMRYQKTNRVIVLLLMTVLLGVMGLNLAGSEKVVNAAPAPRSISSIGPGFMFGSGEYCLNVGNNFTYSIKLTPNSYPMVLIIRANNGFELGSQIFYPYSSTKPLSVAQKASYQGGVNVCVRGTAARWQLTTYKVSGTIS
jgi:hypothetical protein